MVCCYTCSRIKWGDLKCEEFAVATIDLKPPLIRPGQLYSKHLQGREGGVGVK